jgi:hypothetical protein
MDASVLRLPVLVLGFVLSLTVNGRAISDGMYRHHCHAWQPRPRETRKCTDATYPRKRAELDGVRGA